MKHSNDEGVLQTNLLQAFQKNKLIQGKLNERQRLYYVQLVKDMQDHNVQEKLNKELLYAWKKENYVRHLKKKLHEYEKGRYGVTNAYYEYQIRNLDCVMTGQQGLVIPPKEEERRLNVTAKFHQFCNDYPLQTKSPIRVAQSANAVIDPVKQQKDEEDARGIEETWKHIHAQSAVGLKRRKRRSIFPSILRSSTMDEIRRNKSSTKSLVPSTLAAVVSNEPVTTISEVVGVSSEGQRQVVLPVVPTRSTLDDEMEPVVITTDILQKQSGGDLVTMRSVRRPQKNPIDLNITFEARKRIYQINKRVYDYQLCPRKCGLQHNAQFDRPEQIEAADDDENLLVEVSENTRRRYEGRHQADKNFI